MESDPQVLVALVSATVEKAVPVKPSVPIAQSVPDDNNGRPSNLPTLVPSSTLGNIHTTPIRHSLPSAHTINDNDVDWSILDVIARISVSDTNHRAVAVALELDVPVKVAVLRVAISSDDGPDLSAHLKGLWRLMRIISTRGEQLRQRVNQPVPVSDQPSIPVTAGVEIWRTEIIKRVYHYSRSKHCELFQNKSNGLHQIYRSLQFSLSAQSGDQPLKEKIVDGIYSLRAAHHFLARLVRMEYISDQEWGNMIYVMDVATIDITTFLDDPTLCETWFPEAECLFRPAS